MRISACLAVLTALVYSVSGRALSEIFHHLNKCNEHCENESSCVHGCRLMEAAANGNCEKTCQSVADPEQCMKGCKFGTEPKLTFRRVIIRTNIPSLQFGRDFDIANKLMQLHLLSRLPLIAAHRNASTNDESQEKVQSVSFVRIPLVSRCNRLMTLKEWAALQQQRIASGTLECWLIASTIVLLSCTLWLLIWIRQVKQRRERRVLVCGQVDKCAAAAPEQEEKLPEYNNVVDSCKV